MTRRKLTLFLAVTAISLQSDIAHSFPSKRYSLDPTELARQNAVPTPESNMYRFLRQMETPQKQYSPDSQTSGEIDDLRSIFDPEIIRQKAFEEEMALEQQSVMDTQNSELESNGLQRGNIYERNNPNPTRKVIFVSEDDVPAAAAAAAAVARAYSIPPRRNMDNGLQRMGGDDLENLGYSPERAEDEQELIQAGETGEKNAFREADALRQQEFLQEAIRQEEMLQDSAIREASSLRQINIFRGDDAASDPLQQFQIARDAFIYKEEIRQSVLQKQALRQEMLRQEALRQEKEFQDKPERRATTLRQELEILRQLIRQEDIRQENARNLEEAYREEAAIRRDDPDKEQGLLQKARSQENIRQESAKRQEEAIRQSEVLNRKMSHILQQVCINCGPKVVSISNSKDIQIQ